MIEARALACESTGCFNGTRSICDWPVEVEVTVPAISANIGDLWITKQRKKTGKIVEIEYFHGDGTKAQKDQAVKVVIWVQLPGRKHPYPYPRPRFGGAGVPTVRMARCGRYACQNHVREVSDTRHYCQAHWRSWENV